MTTDSINILLSALVEPARRRALGLLWQGRELCVCELMSILGVTQSRMSRHMSVLKAAGLVLDRRDAQWVRYRRKPEIPSSVMSVVESVLAADSVASSHVPSRQLTNVRHKQASA